MNMRSDLESTWGACGIEGCEECLPQFDSNNNPISGPCEKDKP